MPLVLNSVVGLNSSVNDSEGRGNGGRGDAETRGRGEKRAGGAEGEKEDKGDKKTNT